VIWFRSLCWVRFSLVYRDSACWGRVFSPPLQAGEAYLGATDSVACGKASRMEKPPKGVLNTRTVYGVRRTRLAFAKYSTPDENAPCRCMPKKLDRHGEHCMGQKDKKVRGSAVTKPWREPKKKRQRAAECCGGGGKQAGRAGGWRRPKGAEKKKHSSMSRAEDDYQPNYCNSRLVWGSRFAECLDLWLLSFVSRYSGRHFVCSFCLLFLFFCLSSSARPAS
jgi:hypothetical protein